MLSHGLRTELNIDSMKLASVLSEHFLSDGTTQPCNESISLKIESKIIEISIVNQLISLKNRHYFEAAAKFFAHTKAVLKLHSHNHANFLMSLQFQNNV